MVNGKFPAPTTRWCSSRCRGCTQHRALPMFQCAAAA